MTKRTVFAITLAAIMMLLACGSAFSESAITFRNIPWLSSPETVSEIGFSGNEAAQLWLTDDFIVDLGTTEPIDGLAYNSLATTTPTCFKMAAIMEDGLNVAGYDLSYCVIVFAYSVDENGVVLSELADTQLVAGIYNFSHAADDANIARSTDIEEKLTGIYGAPAEKEDIITTWYDEEHNSITLYSFYGVTTLMYKYHDADELIKQAYEAASKDAVSPIGNVDGL